MRVIIQRVSAASVTVEGQVKGAIQAGLMVLLGIQNEDTQEDIQWIATKLVQLRIFDDAEGVMNLSVKDIGGSILLISQFTLYAATKKGNRPSYIAAAKPEVAIPIYEAMIQQLNQELGTPIATGVFGADMQVTLTNNGPVTIFIDSKNREASLGLQIMLCLLAYSTPSHCPPPELTKMPQVTNFQPQQHAP